MSKVKFVIFFFIIFAIFFGCVEMVSRIFFVPGSYEFNERQIIQAGLKQKKPPGEFRIFLFGESTMHGSHLHPRSTIDKWIKIYLENVLDPEVVRHIKIVNFGRLGVASDFIAESFDDLVGFAPDLAVFYTVNNDFIIKEFRLDKGKTKSRFYTWGEQSKKFFQSFAFFSQVKRLAIKFKLARRARKRLKEPPKKEFIDHWYNESHETIHYNPDIHLLAPNSTVFRQLEKNWKRNVERIIQTGQKNNLPVVFFNGIAKLKEYGPFESRHDPDLTPDQLKLWEWVFQKADSHFQNGELKQAQHLYEKTLHWDSQYALVHFRLGEIYEQLGEYEKAESFYMRASDLDYYPIRAPSIVNRHYDELAKQNKSGVHVLDINSEFKTASEHGLIDSQLIIDQIHPTIRGQAIMAFEIVQLLYKNEMLAPRERWHWRRLKSFEELSKNIEMSDDFKVNLLTYSARYVGVYLKNAESFSHRALEINPECLKAKTHLAWIFWRRGNKEEALARYRVLMRQEPKQAKSFFKRQPQIYNALMENSQ